MTFRTPYNDLEKHGLKLKLTKCKIKKDEVVI